MSWTLLVLGRSGQVAREHFKIGPPPGFDLAFRGREDFDLMAGADPAPLIAAHAPAAVINAAAYTRRRQGRGANRTPRSA
ncbi:MAG: sugar nucleotide-binding protein [Caulobacteraceae bacterium]